MICLEDNGWLDVALTMISINGRHFLYSILSCIVLESSLEPFSLLFPRGFQSEEVKVLPLRTFNICYKI